LHLRFSWLDLSAAHNKLGGGLFKSKAPAKGHGIPRNLVSVKMALIAGKVNFQQINLFLISSSSGKGCKISGLCDMLKTG